MLGFLTKTSWPLINKPGKIIILYDDNERHTATVFVQKGIDNVLLSGGESLSKIQFDI